MVCPHCKQVLSRVGKHVVCPEHGALAAPVAAALAEYGREQQAYRRLHRLVDVYEAVIKYAAIIAVRNFYTLHLAAVFPNTDRLIRERLPLPKLGDWVGMLREVLRCFAERPDDLFSSDLFLFYYREFGVKPRPRPLFADHGASGRLLQLRNSLAHGATLPDEEAEGLLARYEPDLLTLLEQARFLVDPPLYAVEGQVSTANFTMQPLMGAHYRNQPPLTLEAGGSLPVGHVVLYNPLAAMFLDLHPLLLYVECLEEVPQWDAGHARVVGAIPCRVRKVLFFNDLKTEDRIAFLDYSRGHHSRFQTPDPLPGEFRTHFPKPSQLARKTEWFSDFIRERTAYFVGR